MDVIKITPRGYCYGVIDAMMLAQQTANNPIYPRPIYIIGMLVHNEHVTEALADAGVITLDGPDRMEILEQVEEGTVIFTAHGISPAVKERARAKGLTVVDATCPDVQRTHDLIKEKVAQGYKVIYIGKKGHPEPEGAIGVAPEHVHLVEGINDVEALAFAEGQRILVTNQTTMSQWDTQELMERIRTLYPEAEIYNEICLATQQRQEAVAGQAKDADITIVVGDPRSNNSNRLAQVSEEIAGVPAHRVANVTEIDTAWFQGKKRVAVTAGASTPTPITKEVINYLEQLDPENPTTWPIHRTIDPKKILPVYREKSR
ncbi:4-hydroxy-3-methylbut-2-enyl diphosphate reductase [Rubeoparvulum massiliense]|uniref:4-hydroxy-3-methylbut-2-enyl diphosphate reductase n=1 Tax=Rubeoparvulum massiliense TaxID=1631346 RepID=UPI00065E1F06|nr:4-hydroxy-3-methylbut-2-enyl diphosphate reductase [Rubeoparvulum massiliense]